MYICTRIPPWDLTASFHWLLPWCDITRQAWNRTNLEVANFAFPRIGVINEPEQLLLIKPSALYCLHDVTILLRGGQFVSNCGLWPFRQTLGFVGSTIVRRWCDTLVMVRRRRLLLLLTTSYLELILARLLCSICEATVSRHHFCRTIKF